MSSGAIISAPCIRKRLVCLGLLPQLRICSHSTTTVHFVTFSCRHVWIVTLVTMQAISDDTEIASDDIKNFVSLSPSANGPSMLLVLSFTQRTKYSNLLFQILFTWSARTTCKSLRSCRLMTGRDVTSTSCLYRCPCDEKDKCHVVLLDINKRYKEEPADICDVISWTWRYTWTAKNVKYICRHDTSDGPRVITSNHRQIGVNIIVLLNRF